MILDLAELSRAVGREVSTYTATPIDPDRRVHSVTGGVYRVTGEDFSLVIKIVRNGHDENPDALWVSGDAPEHRNYWKREWLAFSTGLLDALPGELRAPRTLLTTEHGDDECWIWMESVEGIPGAEFALDDYDSVAFDLATTQSAFASGRSVLPSQPWLSRLWLREWVSILGQSIDALDDDAAWAAHDELALFSPLRSRVKAIWEARDSLLAIVETAPQTVVHLDFWPTNVIAADDGSTVAIDWSQVGIGALGQDLDQLILDPLWMQIRPGESISDLEAHVVRGYSSGLRSSGVDVGEASVRRWYAAAASIHYAPMLAMALTRTADPAGTEMRFGQPFAAIMSDRARVISHAVELGEWVLA